MNQRVKPLFITDVTLQEYAARRESTLSFRETLELAKGLERLQVNAIGLPPIQNVKADTLLIRTIANAVRGTVLSLPVGYTEDSLKAAWNALSGAARPQLCVSLPVSTVQMEYICHMKAPKLQAAVASLVKAARALCGDVMFMAEDATRADSAFLQTVLSTAIEAGATSVGVRDSVGAMLPDEFAVWIDDLFAAVPALHEIPLTVQCSDTLALAAASTLAAIKAGAAGTAVVTEGVSAPSIRSIARIAADKGTACGFTTALNVTEMGRSLQQLGRILGTRRSETSPFDSGVQEESDLTLTAQADTAAVAAAVRALGYELTPEDDARVYEEFCRVAEKKTVSARELEAIVATAAMQVPPTYKLVSFVINSGNQISATAHIKFEKDGRIIEGVSLGDGPIDAAFLAIERIVGRHYELDDFQIQSITQGREAVGSALVKLREGGQLYAGNGISTDIIGASIRAYVNALNKIAYEE
ncbi:MAG: hypothetical protein E7549_06065 [Ruminococcaceae bacterium]|nr:hypothetical protein [Oscillospiraceae bacterium]